MQRIEPIPALLPRGRDGCQFVVYGDCCSGTPGARHEDNFAAMNRVLRALTPAPDFILFLGDHIMGYTEDEAELRAQWTHVLDVEFPSVRQVAPVHHLPGNHDIFDAQSAALWSELFARAPRDGAWGRTGRSYALRRGPVFMAMLDTPAPERNGRACLADLDWLAQMLEAHADARHRFVCGHHPAWPVNGYDEHPMWCAPPDEADMFWRLLGEHKVSAYLCSHIIAFDIQEHAGILQITSAGAGTNYGPGGFMDAPDEYHHLVQMAVDDDGLRLQAIDMRGRPRETLTWPASA